jgi:uncharacterized repeat protein (TIGR03943 family)
VSRAAAGTLAVLVGALLVRVVVDGSATDYVQSAMRPWLVLAGLVVAGIGAASLLMRAPAHTRHDDDHDDHDGHGHVGERVGWLLLAPVVVLVAVVPGALGAAAVPTNDAVRVRAGGSSWPALDASAGTRPMTLAEFDDRALEADGSGRSFAGASVRLVGFVTAGGPADGFRLARFSIACCAADAIAAKVDVVGWDGDRPAVGTWLEVEGRHEVGGRVPRLRADSATVVPTPDDTYE